MSRIGQGRYTLESASVAVDHGVERGVLLRVDNRLVAVLIRLDADYNGEYRGRWHLEAGFGPVAGRAPSPFDKLSDVLVWLAEQLGQSRADVSDMLNEADMIF